MNNKNTKYFCPCCGYNTLTQKPPLSYEICPICYWEIDPVQVRFPDNEQGANRVSLIQARKNFEEIGAYFEDYIEVVRKPNSNDQRKPGWKISE